MNERIDEKITFSVERVDDYTYAEKCLELIKSAVEKHGFTTQMPNNRTLWIYYNDIPRMFFGAVANTNTSGLGLRQAIPYTDASNSWGSTVNYGGTYDSSTGIGKFSLMLSMVIANNTTSIGFSNTYSVGNRFHVSTLGMLSSNRQSVFNFSKYESGADHSMCVFDGAENGKNSVSDGQTVSGSCITSNANDFCFCSTVPIVNASLECVGLLTDVIAVRNPNLNSNIGDVIFIDGVKYVCVSRTSSTGMYYYFAKAE